jgi:LytR cell envelope-related transcriptional attenuator
MRIAEVVGGVALVGVAVLVGIALTEDRQPDTITTDTSPFVFAATTSAARASTSTAEATTSTRPPRQPRTTTTRPPTITTGPPSTAPPATTVPAPPTTTLVPPEQRSSIRVRVLNGGSPPLSATAMTETLRNAGFAPVAAAADATVQVAETMVYFASGSELAALTVNQLVGAPAENVVPVPDGDANWAEFGDGLAVLVVLGSSTG